MTTKIVVYGTNSISMQVRQTVIKLFITNISLNIFLAIHTPDLLILFSC